MYQTIFKMQLRISLKSNKHLYLFTSILSLIGFLLCSCIPPRKALARIDVNSAGLEHNTSGNNHNNEKNTDKTSVPAVLAPYTEHRRPLQSKVLVF